MTTPRKVVESLIQSTSLIPPTNDTDQKSNKSLKNLKLITFTLPIFSKYKYSAYNSPSFTEEMAASYTTMERTSIDIMSKIARILQHTWKYGSATEHFAQQFVFLFESIFTDLDIPDTFKDEQINKFLLESFDDLYFHRQIQTTVHDIFLGLDNAKLKYYIVEILEDKYGYDIPSAFFVIGVCSLGLQLYRDRIENSRKVETLNKVERVNKVTWFK